jgi:hypothetical protein
MPIRWTAQHLAIHGTMWGNTCEYKLQKHVNTFQIDTLDIFKSSEEIDSSSAVYGTHKARGTVAAAQQFSVSVRSKAKSKPEKADLQEESKAQPKIEDQILQLSSEEPKPHPLEYFFTNAFLIFNLFVPSMAEIRVNGVSIAILEGIESGDIFYARVTRLQAEILKFQHVVWPGGHVLFKDEPEVFVAEMHNTLQMLDNKKVL